MVPIFAYTFVEKKDYILCGVIMLISSLTDIIDGMIARKFNMISDFGKVLDPIADKATQLTVAILLSTRFRAMIPLIILCTVKEIFMAISGYWVIKKREIVLGAQWYGKLATVVVVATMIVHLFWRNIDSALSFVSIFASCVVVVMALVLYSIRNLGYLSN